MLNADSAESSSTSHPLWRESGMPEALAVGQIVDRYRVVGRGRRGGMGEVYEVRATDGDGARLALKVILAGEKPEAIDQELRERIRREADSLARLAHPNIVRFVRSGDDATIGPFLVMEWLDGQTLASWLARRQCQRSEVSHDEAGPLTEAELRLRLDLFAQIARAVGHAHQRGIVIRDIKPSNIMVTEADGATTARLVDFGLVTSEQIGSSDRADITATLQRCGSCLYASPEQWYQGRHGVRGDIYSLGVVLFELLVGEHPGSLHPRASWPPSRSVASREAAYRAAIVRATGHPGLAACVARSIEWHERLRYASASALHADLLRALRGGGTRAALSAPARAIYRHVVDRPGMSVATLLAIAGCVTALIFAQQIQRTEAVLVIAQQTIDRLVSTTQTNLARIGNIGEKEAGIEGVVGDLAGLIEADPSNITSKLLMARAEGLAGDAEYRVGRFQSAEERWRSAGERLNRLVADAPDRLDIRRLAIVALIRIGDIAKHDAARMGEAFRVYDEAERLTRALLVDHPDNLDLLDDLCWCLERRVEQANRLAQREEARRVALERLALARSLVEKRPNETLARWNLHQALANCWVTAEAIGDVAAARAYEDEANAVTELLRKGDPENSTYRTVELRSLTIRARRQWGERSKEGVTTLERLALERATLAAGEPGTLSARTDWIESMWCGGLAASLRDDHERACSLLADASRQADQLVEEHDGDYELLSLASRVKGDLSEVLERAGRIEASEAAWRERNAMHERLVAAEAQAGDAR